MLGCGLISWQSSRRRNSKLMCGWEWQFVWILKGGGWGGCRRPPVGQQPLVGARGWSPWSRRYFNKHKAKIIPRMHINGILCNIFFVCVYIHYSQLVKISLYSCCLHTHTLILMIRCYSTPCTIHTVLANIGSCLWLWKRGALWWRFVIWWSGVTALHALFTLS